MIDSLFHATMDASNRQIKLEHFQNLVAVAVADGILDEGEMAFLQERADELGLSGREVEDLLAKAHDLEFLIPQNQVDREEQLADAVFMAMSDGELHEREYHLCCLMAERLDMTREQVDQVVALSLKLWGKKNAD